MFAFVGIESPKCLVSDSGVRTWSLASRSSGSNMFLIISGWKIAVN